MLFHLRIWLCSISVISQSQPLQVVWVYARGCDTDAFNKRMKPPSGKSPCFTRTLKRYQSCFISVYLKMKEGKETKVANTVCVACFVLLLLLHRTEHFS